MKEVRLPSGAVLKIGLAPFEDSKTLFQAMMQELRGMELSSTAEVSSMFKDIFTIGFSSRLIEAALKKCLDRCLYNDQKIGADTFEPAAAREDYFVMCEEVATENVAPFLKPLYARYLELMKKTTGSSPQ